MSLACHCVAVIQPTTTTHVIISMSGQHSDHAFTDLLTVTPTPSQPMDASM